MHANHSTSRRRGTAVAMAGITALALMVPSAPVVVAQEPGVTDCVAPAPETPQSFVYPSDFMVKDYDVERAQEGAWENRIKQTHTMKVAGGATVIDMKYVVNQDHVEFGRFNGKVTLFIPAGVSVTSLRVVEKFADTGEDKAVYDSAAAGDSAGAGLSDLRVLEKFAAADGSDSDDTVGDTVWAPNDGTRTFEKQWDALQEVNASYDGGTVTAFDEEMKSKIAGAVYYLGHKADGGEGGGHSGQGSKNSFTVEIQYRLDKGVTAQDLAFATMHSTFNDAWQVASVFNPTKEKQEQLKKDNPTVVVDCAPKDRDTYTPQAVDLVVAEGEEPLPKDAIANPVELPERTTFAFKEPVDTTVAGQKQATVVVTYPDGTFDEVPVTITVEDRTPPAAPSVAATAEGGATITPPADAETMAVSFVDANDAKVSLTATKVDGTWQVSEGAPADIDPATGVITLAPGVVKDGTEVSATATDPAGNKSAPGSATVVVPDTTAPGAPSAESNSIGGVMVTPPADADTARVVVTYTDEAGLPVTVTAVRGEDGAWAVDGTPSGVEINAVTGVILIAPEAIKDGGTLTAVALDGAGNTSESDIATARANADLTPPSAPVIAADEAGGAMITPPADAAEVTVTFTDETGAEVTVVATRGDDGWTLADARAGISVDPASGVMAVAPDAVADGTEITATAHDAAGNTSPVATLTTDKDTTPPAAPVVAIGDKGSATIIRPADPDTAALIVDFIDEANNAVTVTATKGEDGTWALNADAPAGVTVNPATGTIVIAAQAVQDETEVIAVARDAANNISPEGRGITKINLDSIAPTPPVVDADDRGGIAVTPPHDADRLTITYQHTTAGATTLTATKQGGEWALAGIPRGVLIDAALGTVYIAPSVVADNTVVTATATDAAGYTSEKATATSLPDKDDTPPAQPEVTTPEDGSLVITPPAGDAEKVEITYTDHTGNPVALTATVGADGWALTTTPDGVTIDPATGTITVPGSAIKSGTTSTIVITDAAGNATTTQITAKKVVADVEVRAEALADGSVIITPLGADATSAEITYVTEDNKTETLTIRKTPTDVWEADLPDGVTLDPATGAVTLDAQVIKDGSTVTATSGDQTATAIAGTDISRSVLQRCFASELSIWNPIYWLIPAGVLVAAPLPDEVTKHLGRIGRIVGRLGVNTLLPTVKVPLSPDQSRQLIGAAMVIGGLAATGFYFSACSGAVEVTSSGASDKNSSVDVNQARVDQLSSK